MTPSQPYHDELVEFLKEEVGDSLRVVDSISARGDDPEYEHVYIREDVDKTYSEEEQKNVMDEFVYHVLESDYRRNLFELGEYRYTLHFFDDGIILIFFEGDDRSTVISVDSDFDDILSVARDCPSFLG